MERLTWWIDENTPLVDICVDSNTDGTGCPYIGSDECSNCDIAENVVRRLAEYEDTGLTPEQVQELKEKQIPKPPEYEYIPQYKYASPTAICPICKGIVESPLMNDDYCRDCGQAIKKG